MESGGDEQDGKGPLLISPHLLVKGACIAAAVVAAGTALAKLMMSPKLPIHKRWSCEESIRVILIRHGESENNRMAYDGVDDFHAKRKADPSLTARGQKQAEALGRWIEMDDAAEYRPLHALWVSPCLRTLMTAFPIAKALRVSPEVVTDIYEAGGLYVGRGGEGVGGLSRSEMQKAFPGYRVPSDVTEHGWYERAGLVVGKEDRSVSRTRAKNVVKRIVRMAKDLKNTATSTCDVEDGMSSSPPMRRIALVIHGDFINDLLTEFLHTRVSKAMFDHHNTGLTVLDVFADGETRLLAYNSVEHLRPEKLCLNEALGRI